MLKNLQRKLILLFIKFSFTKKAEKNILITLTDVIRHVFVVTYFISNIPRQIIKKFRFISRKAQARVQFGPQLSESSALTFHLRVSWKPLEQPDQWNFQVSSHLHNTTLDILVHYFLHLDLYFYFFHLALVHISRYAGM